MPNLLAHMDIALESAARLSEDGCAPLLQSAVQQNVGSFILGSCSPDIRAMTKGQRDDTHFAPMSNTIIGTGARNLFQAHPGLGDAPSLTPSTAAFVAGYLSHLVADEAWIILVYRPFFADRRQFRDPILANVMDRALQLEMDRQAMERHGAESLLVYLADSTIGVHVGFISSDTLSQWRERVVWLVEQGFSWERLLFHTRRQYPQDDGTALATAQRFLATLPEGLEQVYAKVPPPQVEAYRATTIREWLRVVREYLA